MRLIHLAGIASLAASLAVAGHALRFEPISASHSETQLLWDRYGHRICLGILFAGIACSVEELERLGVDRDGRPTGKPESGYAPAHRLEGVIATMRSAGFSDAEIVEWLTEFLRGRQAGGKSAAEILNELLRLDAKLR